MKIFIFLSSFLLINLAKSQGIDKFYVDKWIKASDSTFQVDSVKVYFVNGQYFTSYDTLKLEKELKQISVDKISFIGYSKVKECGYQPGRGTIFINSIKKQNIGEIKYNLSSAKKLFSDNYISFSQHIFTDSKDPVLMLDYVIINHTEIKEVFKKLNLLEIYSICINEFPVPPTMYGQNSRNGLVQILTKKKVTK